MQNNRTVSSIDNKKMNLYFRKAQELLIEDRLLIPSAENMDGMSLMLHDVYNIIYMKRYLYISVYGMNV